MVKEDPKIRSGHPAVLEQREIIEREYLAKKATFANAMFILLAALMFVLLQLYDASSTLKWTYGLFFVFLAALNFVMYVYGEYRDNVKLCVYLNALAMYMGVSGVMMEIRNVSAFALLFLTYAVVAAYQERKTTIINHMAFLFIGLVTVHRFPGILMLAPTAIGERVTIYVLLTVFTALMFAASSVMIRKQMFYYDQLAKIKEMDLRMIGTVEDYVKQYRNKEPDRTRYFRVLRRFTEALAKKMDIENVFEERIDIIEALEKMPETEVLKKYPEYSLEEIKELGRFSFETDGKLRALLFKIGQTEALSLPKEDIYTDTPLRTLSFHTDSHYAQIIAFSVFYVLLKKGAFHTEPLTDEQIADVLSNTDFAHLVHSRILDVYIENKDVFDNIFRDAMAREGTT